MKRFDYQSFRRAGYTAAQSLRSAKTIAEWNKLLGEEKVRIGAESEMENYFDVYGEPDGYQDMHGRKFSAEQERDQIERTIERDGCHYVFTQYLDEISGRFLTADSVGMCIYSDPTCPLQNCYVPDLMAAAISAYQAQFQAANI